MHPSFPDLEYFSEVARSGNLSRAAERLGVTQPSLSVAMKRLEVACGTELLIRSKTGVRLTRSGIKLLTRARAIQDSWLGLTEDIKREETRLSGTYRLGCHPSVALYSLKQFMPQLLSNHQKLEIQLEHGLSRKITEAVISYNLDYGLVINPVHHPDLVIKYLLTDVVKIWEHPKNNNRDVLICDPDLIQTKDIVRRIGRKGSPFKRTLTSSNLEVIRSLTESGAGCGLLPSRVALSGHNKSLRPMAGKLPQFKDRLALVFRSDAQSTPASKNFRQAISKTLS